MRTIFGVGNPGNKYANTRHNIGFLILDHFAQKHNLKFKPSDKDFYYTGSKFHTSQFFLIKPTTYVNLSGIAAKQTFEKFDLNSKEFLVVVDDVNLPLGNIRIRQSGGDGGHNGLYSIIYNLETVDFPRLRFGIGSDFQKGDMANYVLSKFEDEVLTSLKPNINLAINLIEEFIKDGIKSSLEYYSKFLKKINQSKTNNLEEHTGE